MTTLSKPDYDFVRTVVRQRAGIVLDEDKAYLVETRLTGLARREGLESAVHLVDRARGEPNGGLSAKMVEAMTTNETSFFRDVHPFDALRTHVLPEAIKKQAAARTLTIWCGAASTGQEPYTLAIILREHFRELAGWDVRIIATDLSMAVLEQARKGAYSQLEVNRGLPAPYLAKYFRRVGLNWQADDSLRQLIEFRPYNLLEPSPALPSADLVMLRNVLIYFDVPTKKAILGRVRKVLKPDGFLFLGGAESTIGIDDNFQRVTFDRTSAYRHARAQGATK